MTMQHIYQGWITLRDWENEQESGDVIYVLPNKPVIRERLDYDLVYEDDIDARKQDPFARVLEYDIGEKKISVRYYISEEAVTLEEAQECWTKKLLGCLYARYDILCGTEWYGCSQKLSVGGDNFYEELSTFDGKYLVMVVEIIE